MKRLLALVLFLLILTGCTNSKTSLDLRKLEGVIKQAENYLTVIQNEDGSFNGYSYSHLSPSKKMSSDKCGFTIYIAHNLQEMQANLNYAAILQNAAKYILQEGMIVDGNYFWRWGDGFPFDADDTVLASLFLEAMGQETPISLEVFKMTEEVYRTWLGVATEESDDILNTNVLVYKIKNGYSYDNLLDTLSRSFIEKKLTSYYYYYPYEAFLYYLSDGELNKEFFVSSFGQRITQMIKQNDYKSVVKNSYLGYALAKYGINHKEQESLIKKIIASQNEDGSWDAESTFFGPYKAPIGERIDFGSKEFSTSLALRFLNEFRLQNNKFIIGEDKQ